LKMCAESSKRNRAKNRTKELKKQEKDKSPKKITRKKPGVAGAATRPEGHHGNSFWVKISILLSKMGDIKCS